jgi:adenylate kinase
MAYYIVLMGAPGAGKGTQAKMLESNLGLPQVATGDIFRHNLKNKTELGLLAQSYMDRGKLVPDSVTIQMVRARLSQPECAEGAILDGFPRNTVQAEALNDLLTELGGRIIVAPYIRVSQEVVVARLLQRAEIEGRADDNEETIRTRMKVYQEQTAPLLDYYRQKNLLVEVNGEQSIDEVQQSLLLLVQKAATAAEN